jgi:WD40 repeat protein
VETWQVVPVHPPWSMPPPPVPDRTETLSPRADSSDGVKPEESRERPIGRSDDPDRYEQVCEHARGGLGRVVRAVDKRLGRTVAVKELLPRAANGSTAANEARFLREALITARLEHPGIVPVHEAGRWPSGDPYYVMKLVEGRTLKELITSSSTLRDRLALLPHAIAVADAVGYAHSQGVIHRDLKPSNVIIGEFGETIVVDWGLARDCRRDVVGPHVPDVPEEVLLASGSGVETVSGKVVGTPAYMSPEQARGELVDERADVYAIGAVLYELLAGMPPHHDDTPQATLERVIAGPPRPVACVPHVPGELATIVSKAMERDPEHSYANATALAEDLRRYQTGKLVSAHTYSSWALLRKKIAQHRGVVVMAAASALALGAVGVESFRRVVAERNNAQHASAVAEDARRDAEKRQRDLVLLQAATALRKDPTASLAWLKTYELTDADRAHVLDVVDEAIALGVARHVFRPSDWVYDAQFTPDGKLVVAAVRDGSIRAYDLRTGSERRLGKAEGPPEVLAMSPDGSLVVVGSAFGGVSVFPLDGGPSRTIAQDDRMVASIHFGADRSRVLVQYESGPAKSIAMDGKTPDVAIGDKTSYRTVVASSDWTRSVVSTSPNQIAALEGGKLRPLAQTQRMIKRIVVAPRGDLVIIHDGAALWSVPFSGGPLVKLVDYAAEKLTQIAWSPDGRSVAIAGDVHDVVVVDVQTQQAHYLRGHTDAIYSVQWTRDGRRLLSASDDSTARVWTISDGTSQVLRGHDDDVYRARFSQDERQVVTNSLDGSVRVWVIEQPGARVLVEGAPLEDLQLDGSSLRTKTSTEIARWNVTSGHREPLFSWAADPNGLGLGLPSPDGEKLLIPSGDWSLEVRDRTGKSVALRGHKEQINHLEFGKDSKHVYTSSIDGTLRKWDLDTGEAKLLVHDTQPVRALAVGADGRVAVRVGDTAQLVTPGGTVMKLGTGSPWCILKAEFEKVRDRLVMHRCDHSLVMLDGDRMIELPTGNHMISRIAFSADGTRIAAGMSDRTVRVWDAASGRVLRVLRGHADLVLDVAFSPDGMTLASASYDKTIRVWDLASERHRVLRGHALSVNRVLWRDPVHLVSASRDGTLRLWDVPATDLPSVGDLARQLDAATSARIDIDRPTTGAPRGI